jgi:hypothetical protein
MGVRSCSVRDPFLKFGWPVCGRWFKVSNMSGSRSRATAELRPWSLSVSARTNSPQTRPPSLSVADFRANLTDQARGGVRNVSLEVTNVVPPHSCWLNADCVAACQNKAQVKTQDLSSSRGSGCQPSPTREIASQASTATPRMRRKGFTPRCTSSPAHNAKATEPRTTRTPRTQPWGRLATSQPTQATTLRAASWADASA